MLKHISGYSSIDEGETVWEEETDELVRPGGLPATEAVAEIARSLGYQTTEPEADIEHSAWEFYAKAGRSNFSLLVWHMDEEFHVGFDNMTGCLGLIAGNRRGYKAFIQAMHDRMAGDPRFREIVLEK